MTAPPIERESSITQSDRPSPGSTPTNANESIINDVRALRGLAEQAITHDKKRRIREWLFAILKLIPIIVAIFSATIPLLKRLGHVEQKVGQIEAIVSAQDYAVTLPRDGDEVSGDETVRGRTLLVGRNHYLVITSLKDGTDYVVGGPAQVSASGLITSSGRFGDHSAGSGEKFVIRFLATEQTLAEGPLSQMPGDAIISQQSVVTRKP